MVDKTVEHFGKIDALINNAGAIFWGTTRFPIKRYDLVMDVNVRGAFLASQAAIPHMRTNGGHIAAMSPPSTRRRPWARRPTSSPKRDDDGRNGHRRGGAQHRGSRAVAVTGIRTAATVNLGMGSDDEWRTPEIWPMRPSRCS